MAQVDLAQKSYFGQMKKLMALKRILPQFSESKDFRELFESEAKILLQFNHPHLVQFYDYGLQNNQLYIAMEYIQGRNLKQLWSELNSQQKKFPLEVALCIAMDVAEGLSAAHEMKNWYGESLTVIHRDISPHNIMMGYDGGIKIIDFGISKNSLRTEMTEAGSIRGKYGYMSPEQIQGGLITPQSDIYSLGVVLWELITGQKLFTPENNLRGDVPTWKKMHFEGPEIIEQSLLLALKKDPDLRYESAQQMKDQLHACLRQINPMFKKSDFKAWIKNNFSHFQQADRQRQMEHITTNEEVAITSKDPKKISVKRKIILLDSDPERSAS